MTSPYPGRKRQQPSRIKTIRITIPLPSRPADYVPNSGPPLRRLALQPPADSTAYIDDRILLPPSGLAADGRPLPKRMKYIIGWRDLPAARLLVPAMDVLDYVSPHALEEWEYSMELELDVERARLAAERQALKAQQTLLGRADELPRPKVARPPLHHTSIEAAVVAETEDGDGEQGRLRGGAMSLSTPKKRKMDDFLDGYTSDESPSEQLLSDIAKSARQEEDSLSPGKEESDDKVPEISKGQRPTFQETKTGYQQNAAADVYAFYRKAQATPFGIGCNALSTRQLVVVSEEAVEKYVAVSSEENVKQRATAFSDEDIKQHATAFSDEGVKQHTTTSNKGREQHATAFSDEGVKQHTTTSNKGREQHATAFSDEGVKQHTTTSNKGREQHATAFSDEGVKQHTTTSNKGREQHASSEEDDETDWAVDRIEDMELYEVEGRGLVRYFKVRWEGDWPPDQNPTWEPEENLPDDLVREFCRTFKGRKKGSSEQPRPARNDADEATRLPPLRPTNRGDEDRRDDRPLSAHSGMFVYSSDDSMEKHTWDAPNSQGVRPNLNGVFPANMT
ncbi:hypothetical protein MY10362_004228 [Beauveria mimosiformis]